MPDDAPRVQDIVFLAAADIMNHERPTLRVGLVRDNSDVIQIVLKLPRHDVARLPLRARGFVGSIGKRATISLEENDLIGHAPMIDVGVDSL